MKENKKPDDMTTKQTQHEDDTKRLILHQWFDKVAYGLIIAFAIMIYDSTESSKGAINSLKTDMQSFRAEVQTTLRHHSQRITRMELQLDDLREKLEED